MVEIVKPRFEILGDIDGINILKQIEIAGRTSYKSEERITEDSCLKFVKMIISRGHESVIEHLSVSVRIICDRGVSHEIVRHRIASYTQESTRYCNYSKRKFGNEITVIKPPGMDQMCERIWTNSMENSERNYMMLLDNGVKPQIARSVLPNSLKTEIICTFNLREWRHFFKLRCSKNAHPQMREITIPLLTEMSRLIPVIFDDIIA